MMNSEEIFNYSKYFLVGSNLGAVKMNNSTGYFASILFSKILTFKKGPKQLFFGEKKVMFGNSLLNK
jgi:hypothetical protein